MTFEDKINISKKTATVSANSAAASIARGLKGISAFYGFDLEETDPRFTVVRTERGGGVATVTYGPRGRKLDASQLAYELNN